MYSQSETDELFVRCFPLVMKTNNPQDWRELIPRPQKDDHKYSRGYANILGGEHMTGATALAARAAQRMGCGIVNVLCPKGAGDVYRILLPSVVVKEFRDTREYKDMLEDPRIHALLVGPGLGGKPANTERVLAAIRMGKPIVIDADALSILAGTGEGISVLFREKFTEEQCRYILFTPHRGEFARLFPEFADLPSAEAAKSAAQQSGVTILLKGAASTIAHPGQQVCVNPDAPADLATAGSGDVLSGLCLGLMAQGLSAYDSACIATAIHSRAAGLYGPGLIAEDLNDLVPIVLKSLLA